MLLSSFQAYGLSWVSRSSVTLQGPSSWNRPISESEPGPPLSHSVRGAVSGLLRASKNLIVVREWMLCRRRANVGVCLPEKHVRSLVKTYVSAIVLHTRRSLTNALLTGLLVPDGRATRRGDGFDIVGLGGSLPWEREFRGRCRGIVQCQSYQSSDGGEGEHVRRLYV